MLAGIGLMLASSTSVLAQELTIFWAEWDPANYLQELVNEYEAETGVKVTVETTPWPDFQTKAFTEFNAKGSAYDMVVGDSQWLGAASTGRPLCRPHRLLQQAQADRDDGSGHHEVLLGISGQLRQVLVDPARRRRRRLGLPQGLVRRSERDGQAFKAKYGYDLAVPKDLKQLRDIAEFFHRPDQNRYGVAIYTDNSDDALVMGVENAIFSYGGELGDYADLQGRRHHQLDQNVEGARSLQASSTASRLRAGPRRSSSRTTRRSPKAWWR